MGRHAKGSILLKLIITVEPRTFCSPSRHWYKTPAGLRSLLDLLTFARNIITAISRVHFMTGPGSNHPPPPSPHYHHTLHWSSHLNWVWHLLSFPLPNLKIYSRLRALKRIGGPSYGNQLCSPLTGAWMAHVHQIYENPPIRPRYQCHLKTVVEHK